MYIYVYLWNHPAHQQWGFLPGDPKQFASHRIRSHLLPLRGHWTGLYRYLWPGAGLGVDAWMCIPRIGSVVYNPCVTHIIPYIEEDIPYITGGKSHVLNGARSPKYSDMSMKISWDTHDITDWNVCSKQGGASCLLFYRHKMVSLTPRAHIICWALTSDPQVYKMRGLTTNLVKLLTIHIMMPMKLGALTHLFKSFETVSKTFPFSSPQKINV